MAPLICSSAQSDVPEVLLSEDIRRRNLSNINSQLDVTITDFTDNYNQLNMFRAIISPILRRTTLWYKAPTMLPAGNFFGPLYHKL
jgi:hypothetical protein